MVVSSLWTLCSLYWVAVHWRCYRYDIVKERSHARNFSLITIVKISQRPHRGHSDITMTQTIAQQEHCGPLGIQCPTFSKAIFLSIFKKIAKDARPQRRTPTVCGDVTTATTSLRTTPIYVPTSQRPQQSLIALRSYIQFADVGNGLNGLRTAAAGEMY